MTSEREARAGVRDDAMLMPATSAVETASTFSEVTTAARKSNKGSATWLKGPVWTRRIGLLLAVAAVLLIPWTAWLALVCRRATCRRTGTSPGSDSTSC